MKKISVILCLLLNVFVARAQDTTEPNYLKFRGGIVSTAMDNLPFVNGTYSNNYVGSNASTILNLKGGISTGIFQMEAFYYGLLRFRNKTDNNSWTPWKTIYHSGNTDTATYVRATLNNWIKDKGGNNRFYFQSSATAGEGATIIQGAGNYPVEIRNGADQLLMKFASNGNIGVGVVPQTPYKLAVAGTIGARKVKVTQETWADFVFAPDYQLLSVPELRRYIREHQHLPDVPSAREVKEEGLDLGEMNKKLLQKVEELTLYLLEAHDEMDKLKQRVVALESSGQ